MGAFKCEGKIITLREAEVMLCCAKSMTIKETAEFLGISCGTIRKHHDNLRSKFDLKGYHTLTCFAAKHQAELEKYVT